MRDLIAAWKIANGRIDTRIDPFVFDGLIQTLLDNGATRDDIESSSLQRQVGQIAISANTTKAKHARSIVEEKLKEAITNYYGSLMVDRVRVSTEEERSAKLAKIEAEKQAAEAANAKPEKKAQPKAPQRPLPEPAEPKELEDGIDYPTQDEDAFFKRVGLKK